MVYFAGTVFSKKKNFLYLIFIKYQNLTGKDPFVKEDEGHVDESGKMRPPVKKKKKKGAKDPVPEPFVPVKKENMRKEQAVDIEKNFLAKCEMDFIPGLDTEDLEIVMPAFYEKPFFEYAEEVKEKKRQEIREERERLRKLKEMQVKQKKKIRLLVLTSFVRFRTRVLVSPSVRKDFLFRSFNFLVP